MVAKLAVEPQYPSFVLKGPPFGKSSLSFAEKRFTIIRMNETPAGRFVSPSVDIDTQIVESCIIGVERSSIRPKYADVQRREVQNLPELHFLFLEPLFRVLALTNCGRTAEELHSVPGLGQDGMANGMNPLDHPTRQDDAEIHLV